MNYKEQGWMQRQKEGMEASAHEWEAVHSFFTCSSGRNFKIALWGDALLTGTFCRLQTAAFRHSMDRQLTPGAA